MRRPRHPLPLELGRLTYNIHTSRYEIVENDITYSMTLEHTRMLKAYYHNLGNKCTVADWYNDLSRDLRKEIIRTGVSSEDGFYADVSWE